MMSVKNVRSTENQWEGNEQPPELFRKSELTDITLVVEGKELYFAKYILTEGSNVLAKMIKSSPDPSRLKLDDVTYKDLILFLECVHPKRFLDIKETNVEPVTTIARKFEFERLLSICEQHIIQMFNQMTNTAEEINPTFLFYLRVADKCGLQHAIEVGVSSKQVKDSYFSERDILFDNKKGYETDINFSQLTWETKFKLLRCRLKKLETNPTGSNQVSRKK